MMNWFTGRAGVDFDGEYTFRATAEFEGALAQRVYYTTFVVEGLSAIRDTQARILQLLQEHAGESRRPVVR